MVEYNKQSFSSIVIGLFLAKLVLFLFITNIFIAPTLDSSKAQNFACNIVMGDIGTQTLNTPNIDKNAFGITVGSITGISSTWSSIKNIATCSISSQDMTNYLNDLFGIQLNGIVKFLLFDMINFIIAIMIIRPFLKF